MPPSTLLRSLVLVLALSVGFGAATVTAQRTWIVDAASGPGTDFTDLPPAVAAASDGDVLVVRAGSYADFTTGKGITILGVPGATMVRGFPWFGPCFRVAGLPAGRTFRAYGLVLQENQRQQVEIEDCAGSVHLEDVRAGFGSYPGPIVSIVVTRSPAVTLVGCGTREPYWSSFVVHATASRVQVVRCTLKGVSALDDPRAGSRMATAGLTVGAGGVVDLVDGPVFGGHGVAGWFGPPRPSAPAIHLNGGTVRLRRGAATNVLAGIGVDPGLPIPAIAGTGVVDADATVPIVPYAGAPAIEPSVTASTGPWPGLSQSGGDLGAPITWTIASPPGGAFVLAAGTFATPLATPVGDLFLDLSSVVVFVGGTQPPAGTTTTTVPVPTTPVLRGQGFGVQAAAATSLGVRLTNATVVVLR
jgi:hypothetical protein